MRRLADVSLEGPQSDLELFSDPLYVPRGEVAGSENDEVPVLVCGMEDGAGLLAVNSLPSPL